MTSIWYGKEEVLCTPGKALNNSVIARRIFAAGLAGSGWKFYLVTKSTYEDKDAVGEICTIVRPVDKNEYTSLLFLPTLATSGKNATESIGRSQAELTMYRDILTSIRQGYTDNWQGMKLDADRLNSFSEIVDAISRSLSSRNSALAKQAGLIKPTIHDSTGRPNPSAAASKHVAMESRLSARLSFEDISKRSVDTRAIFAETIIGSIHDDIRDMGKYRLSAPALARQLEIKLTRARIKPVLWASLYCDYLYPEGLDTKEAQAKVIELFSAEISLMIVRELINLKTRDPKGLSSVNLALMILEVSPSEPEYQSLFKSIHHCVTGIKSGIEQDLDISNDIQKAKVLVRNRASSDPNHPWYLKPLPLASS